MKNTGVPIHVDIQDAVDNCTYPSALNFLPPDTFREIVDQPPPAISDITVAFPMRVDYQQLEEMVKIDRCKLFLAKPPPSTVPLDNFTDIQQWAYSLSIDMKQQIVYLCGRAGSGKTEVALKICEHFAGRVQAAAITGKAASLFGAPTVHGMFRWSHYDKSLYGEPPPTSAKKITELQTFYENIDVFVIDEVNAMSAAMLAQLDQTMTKIFNPKLQRTDGTLLPFGGVKVVFLGDPAQLCPVVGEPIYAGDTPILGKPEKAHEAKGKRQVNYHLTAKGQELYRKYLEPNCVVLCRGQRNSGLLQQICDRLRANKLTDKDRSMLMRQTVNFPDYTPDFTLHYDNDSCSSTNWRQLWSECRSSDPPKRLYVCRAMYHTTDHNDQVVNGLAAVPSSKFKFASDVLCISLGCDVRLVKNINVSAGLVNSTTGTVVAVIYDNADAKDLSEGS